MPKYDKSRFDPPAPIAHVALRNPNSKHLIDTVAMLIDTGADITLVPEGVVNLLHAPTFE